MPGLPKKYAKMGFKKGWRAFKASKRTTKRKSYSQTTVKRVVKRRSKQMAKRRKSYRKKSAMSGVTGLLLGGAGYGVIREPLSQLSAQVPLIGGLGDEVALLALSWVMATRTSGIFKKIGKAGLVIEAHNLTRNLSSGMLSNFLPSAEAPASKEMSFK